MGKPNSSKFQRLRGEQEEQDAFLPEEPAVPADVQKCCKEKIRNLAAFWLFGACSSYMYVVMLSAAYDILGGQYEIGNATSQENDTSRGRFDCNPLSTGAVLLANVLPDMFVTLSAPWYLHHISYDIKVFSTVTSAVLSCLIVSLSPIRALTIFGVVCAGISGGLGEFTCVSLLSFYDKNVVSAWSSGTGGAGIVASIVYAGLIEVGMTPRNALLVQVTMPLGIVVGYWCVLVRVPTSKLIQNDVQEDDDPDRLEEYDPFQGKCEDAEERHLTFEERAKYFQYLLKYIIPLWLVYFGSYFINHGLLELIFVRGIWLSHESQYRWFQVLYQVGVFISRSSINLFTCRILWIFPILQWAVLVLILSGVYFEWTPSIFLIFGIIFFEGIVSGASYVNTFYLILQNEDPKYKEFAMGATTASESCGIAIAGMIAIPVHDAICRI